MAFYPAHWHKLNQINHASNYAFFYITPALQFSRRAKGYYGEVGYAITPELKIFDNYEPNPKPAIDSAELVTGRNSQ
jgi:hypothetical protein